MKNNILSRTVRPNAGCQSVRKADDLQLYTVFVVHNAGDGLTRNRYYKRLCTTPRVSTICLPDVTARDQIFPCSISYWKR